MATVTFLFADQAGSTVQLERLGDAGAKGVRQALIDMLRQAAEDHHGEIVDHTGDGLMICFASAVDAVACGVVVQQQAARHNARHPEAEALGVRVGIHTGEPLVNDEGRYFGVPVVIAARLCAAAGTGQVLVSDVTRALVAPRRAHRFTPLGERALKGIAEPVAVAAVDWAPEETEFALPEVLAAAVGGPLVGRAAELEWLEGLWAQAAGAGEAARRRVVLLAGDPGIGKTRLAAALAGSVHERGGLVLYGRCDEEPAGPYQPLAEALDPYVASVPRAELRQQLGPAGGVLTRVLPRLAERVPHLAGPARLEPETEPFLVAEAVEGLLVAVARTTPTLLVLDDLHWADAVTLLVVRQLARGTAPAPLLVLGCYREPDVGRSRVLAEAGVDPRRPGPTQHRTLTGLPAAEVAELLAAVTGQAPPEELVRTVDAETEGNPFFVHQLAGNLVEKQLAQKVGRAARRARTARLDLRGVREELVAGVLELQRVRDRPGGPGADAEGHAGLLTAEIEPDGTPPVPTDPPYKGLVRFEAGDARLFFGRERLVAQLVARLVTARFLAVLGASGSGKSSLVRAGLLPALAAGALPGSDTWVPLVLAPGAEPLAALAERLAPLLPGTDPPALATRLEAGPGTRDHRAAEALAGRAEAARLLVVVDQFEEVFTACRDEAARRRFVDLLVTAAQAREGRCVVALALRADFYGRCATHAELAAELADSQVLVGPMTDQELRRAVLEPARRVGCVVEPGLPETILEDVAAEPGALPLVSTALLETWERRRGRSLTLTAYAETGGVRGAVARLADGVYDGFDPAEQATARALFLRLTEPGEGSDDLRRRARREELGDDPVTERVLGVLVTRRLVIADQHTVEVAHEALLREWPRLRSWLEADREGRRLHRHLGEATADWEAHHHDPEQLYRGARLAAALDWAKAHAPDLNQPERQFLDASRAAAEQQVADARQRAEREARINRRLRGLLAGLAVVLVAALVAGGLALAQRDRAERQALVADSGRLGALALTEGQLDRSLLLARQAVALDDSLQSRGDLLAVLLRSPAATAIMRPRLEGIAPLDLSPDGRLLAMGDYGGQVAVYDVRTRRPIPGDFRAAKPVNDLDFSPDGSLLAVATGAGLVQLWDVRTATLRHQLRTAPYAEGVEFSADGRTLVTMSADEGLSTLSGLGDTYLTRWDTGDGSRLEGPVKITSRGGEILLTTPDRARLVVVARNEVLVAAAETLRPARRFLGRRGQPEQLGAAVRPTDGRTLALGLQDGAVELLDLSTGRRRRLGRQEGSVDTVTFSADGATLVTGDVARRVRLWDVASGRVRETFEGHETRVVGFRFSPDGRTLYSAGSSSVIAWDLEGSGRLGRPFTFAPAPPLGGADNPLSFAISPDGSNLATPDGKALDKIALRDLRAPKQIRRRLSPEVGGIFAMAFRPDGRHLAVGGERADSAPVLVDVTSGRVTRRMTGGHDGGFHWVAFDPGGQRLLTGGYDRRAIVWDVETGRQLLELRHPGDDHITDTAVAWSPDGTLVATAGGNGLVAVWRAADGKQVATFKGDTEWVLSVAFSPDGSLIAAGALADKQATLWEVATGKRVGRLPHPTVVSQATFDPGGRTLATAGSDGALRLWDVASRRQIGLAFPGPARWSTPIFDPAGDHLVALYGDGSAMVWNVDPDHWKERACTVASRTLTREEWDALLPYRRYQPACR